ncbi:MAG TPA: restriction endonuclease subunit S [bacterium]|nr:restriction endonuclease subunit S [bacterium]
MINWIETSLGEISKFIQYGYTESASQEPIGPKFLRITDIQGDCINWSDVPYCKISSNDYKKYKLEMGDIVIARTGNSTGATAFINDNIDAVFASYLIRYKIDPKIADPFYIGILLRSKKWKSFVNSIKGGSAQAGANAKIFAEFPISLPPIEDQRRIAHFVLLFDDKINLLRRQNETLEQIAQTLFKRWFVDFEFPYDFAQGKPDLNGQPYKSSGGEMVASELGEIPKGWRIGKFGDEFTIIMGQSPPGKSYNEDQDGEIFFQGRTDFGFRFPKVRIYTNQPKRMAKKLDVLVSVRAPVGDVNIAMDKCCIGRGLAAVSSKRKSYCLYKVKSLKRIFDLFESEGTVFGALNKENFHNIDNILPEIAIISQFENITSYIDNKIFNNELEIRTLINIRDKLLPKLMSGKIRIK